MIVTKNELWEEKERYAKHIEKGEIFLHPTDTINGLGVDATNDEAVQRLRKLKHNLDTPMSVIAPSKEWIRQNCEVPKYAEPWLDKLPGPYTLVFRLKNREAVSRHVNPKDGTLGVRIPAHWISEFVEHVGVPVITTSANIQGDEYKEDLEELHPDIQNNTKFMIYEVSEGSSPSDIIILTGDEPQVIKRR